MKHIAHSSQLFEESERRNCSTITSFELIKRCEERDSASVDTMAGSFTICSSRLLSVTIVEMCPTMDLIVILNAQGMLTVYRTLSW